MRSPERRGLRPDRGVEADARAVRFGFRFVNAVLLFLGVGAIATGYVLLSHGSVTAAPLLLVLGYAGLIPAGLLVGIGRGSKGE